MENYLDKYTETLDGFTLNIVDDEHPLMPNENGCDDAFLIADHRQFYVWSKLATCEQVREALSGDEDADTSIKDEYHIFPVEAYIHSGVSLKLWDGGVLRDRFDSCVCAFVLVSKKEWADKKDARGIAEGMVEHWNEYLSGEVYGYEITENEGEVIDSCYGYFGTPEASGLLDEARGILKCRAQVARLKKQAQLKAKIIHHVPLLAR